MAARTRPEVPVLPNYVEENAQMVNPEKNEQHESRVRQPVSTSGTWLLFDLDEEIKRLKSEQPWQAEHTAKTIVKYSDLRVVLVALRAGGQLQEHKAAGRISIQSLTGTVRVKAAGKLIELPAGKLLTLDRDVLHHVEAVYDSVFLLTIAWAKQAA
jgi:quercetin dioxygenase-like cupin family protein